MRYLNSGCSTLLAAFACTVFVSAALADIITFSAELKGSNEVPPNESQAFGSSVVTFDTESRELVWSISYSDIDGSVIGAHIHGPASSQENAGILIPLDNSKNPITGKLILNGEQAAHIEAGMTYINLHSEKIPSGELRGQLSR